MVREVEVLQERWHLLLEQIAEVSNEIKSIDLQLNVLESFRFKPSLNQ